MREQTFPCHTDSVWDLRMHATTVATAGLDGAVILYDFVSDYDLTVRCYIQVGLIQKFLNQMYCLAKTFLVLLYSLALTVTHRNISFKSESS